MSTFYFLNLKHLNKYMILHEECLIKYVYCLFMVPYIKFDRLMIKFEQFYANNDTFSRTCCSSTNTCIYLPYNKSSHTCGDWPTVYISFVNERMFYCSK